MTRLVLLLEGQDALFADKLKWIWTPAVKDSSLFLMVGDRLDPTFLPPIWYTSWLWPSHQATFGRLYD